MVGHDFGGACISYAMEVFPSKVAKAVFVTATMLTNGQSTLDMFSQQDGGNDVMRQAQIFLYANGIDHPPTVIDLDKSLLKDVLFNQSPVKDVALASVSMRPIPFAPVLEKLSLTENNYGSVRRFYIETSEDNAMPLLLQQTVCDSNPPKRFSGSKVLITLHSFRNPKLYTSSWWRLQRCHQTKFRNQSIIKICKQLLNRMYTHAAGIRA